MRRIFTPVDTSRTRGGRLQVMLYLDPRAWRLYLNRPFPRTKPEPLLVATRVGPVEIRRVRERKLVSS